MQKLKLKNSALKTSLTHTMVLQLDFKVMRSRIREKNPSNLLVLRKIDYHTQGHREFSF